VVSEYCQTNIFLPYLFSLGKINCQKHWISRKTPTFVPNFKTTSMSKFRLSYFAAILGIAAFSVLAFNNMATSDPDGPPTNRCGLYGTQQTCTACHSASGVNNATATIAIGGNPTGYTPGQVYPITITATGGLSYGFEMACVSNADNTSAGNLANSTGTETANGTVSGNSIRFIRQSTPNNAGTWTFDWTAPATDIGPVTFYAAILAANTINGTGNDNGDKTRTATLTLAPAITCIPLTVNVSGSATFCAGGSTTLTANGGTNYAWSNGGSTAATTVTTAGTYTVTATDANACTGTATTVVSVTALPTPNIVASTGTNCAGGTRTYNVSNPGPSGTQYNWTVTGGTITAGQGTANVTVQWGAGGTGNIAVAQTNP
jgi:hypothetical protein